MSSKHFINDPEHLVNSALNAIASINPGVGIDNANKIVYIRPRHKPTQQKVAIISGGGSGHEPAFASMVGPGMLSAAVVGNIFASPNAEQVRTAIMSRVSHNDCTKWKADLSDEGVLLIIMNYTGDVLNFGVAVEKARAAGINVEMVVVGDDVAIGRSKAGKVGRRGIAGTILVQKLSGALAAMGHGIRQVTDLARLFADNVASIGVSLEHVHVPGFPTNNTAGPGGLRAGEVEIGMGIHNEQGMDRMKATLPELIENMLEQLLKQDDTDRSFVDFSQCSTNIVLLVNNLGGLSMLELAGITNEVVVQLDKAYNIQPLRIFSGTYITSLNAPGFSISLLKIIDTGIDELSMLDLLDYPSEVPGWTSSIKKTTWEAKDLGVWGSEKSILSDETTNNLMININPFQEALTTGLENLIAAEPLITHYDTIVGDGDCGVCLKRGARAILEQISIDLLSGDIVTDLRNIICAVERSMDGTSGALYSIFLHSLSRFLRSLPPGSVTTQVWIKALKESCNVLSKYTPARPGDRTLIDALYPFVEVLEKTADLRQASIAAMDAANKTKGLKASLGRTVYIGGSAFEQVPDPGAWGLASFLLGLAGVRVVEETFLPDILASKPV